MTLKEINWWIDEHFLYEDATKDKYLVSAGLARDWPDGRGFFVNNDKSFLVWVNEEDHFRIMSMQKGGNIKYFLFFYFYFPATIYYHFKFLYILYDFSKLQEKILYSSSFKFY